MKNTIKRTLSIIMILTLVMTMMLAGTPAYAKSKKSKSKAPKTVVTLSHSGTLTMTVGESITVTASTQNPEGAEVTWKSSKTKVATVSGGTITAKGEGSATITAKSGKGKAKVKVKVVDPNKPTKVSIAQGKSVTVDVGQSVQLSASVNPSSYSGGVSWSSSKPKVATVDGNGNMTGVAKGKAKITVKAGKKKASITVNVKGGAEATKVSKVTLDRSGTVKLALNETLTLNASIQPAGASGNITWSSSKPAVATVNNGVVTPVKKGTTTITAKCGKKKAKVKVKVVGASEQTHVHNFTEPVYATRHVVDTAAWDETVVTKAAWDETVVVKEAWTETVVDKAAWTEKVFYDEPKIKCETCGKVFDNYDAWSKEMWAKTKYETLLLHGVLEHDDGTAEYCPEEVRNYYLANGLDKTVKKYTQYCWHGGSNGYSTTVISYYEVQHPAETHTVDHPAETKVVHHDAETKVVHHDEVGHDEQYVSGYKCACGAVQ